MTRFTISTPPDFRYLPTVLSHGWCVLHPFSYDEAGTLSRIQNSATVRLSVSRFAPIQPNQG